MAELLMRELENASLLVQAPPDVVSSEQRHAAEQVFLNLRKSKMPYSTFKEILEKCRNDYVLFQVASAIKECVLREWNLLEVADIDSLRSFLLTYCINHLELSRYVREQILQVFAVIVKRGTLDQDVSVRQNLLDNVNCLVTSGNLTMQLIACSVLAAVLNEYSSTSRSSSVGLTWEFHNRCKLEFEKTDMNRIFTMSLQVLQELEKIPAPWSAEVTLVFSKFLSITEQIFTWEFVPQNLPRRYIGTFLSNQSVSFKPPVKWKDTILNAELIDMLFRLYMKVRNNSELSHHALQCISQLASLNGPIFSEEKLKLIFLQNFIEAFLKLLSVNPRHDYEALGIANVFSSLLMFFQVSVLVKLPSNLLQAFFSNMTSITCSFGQSAAGEEALHSDDTLFMEAFEKMMDSWMHILVDSGEFPPAALAPCAQEIFNSFLQCHLAPPDGNRTEDSTDDVEYDEVEEDDRDRFKDQLCSIGTLGREVPQHATALLTRLLEDRVSRLHGQLKRQQHTMSPGGSDGTDQRYLNVISEDLHWLILVTAHFLTDDAVGETPMIPAPIMQYSISQSSHIDLHTTLKVLASPGHEATAVPGCDSSTDPVIRLISAVFRLCEVERLAASANMAHLLSPQVGQSVMWFLSRWAQSYLLPDENHYTQISQAINAAFGSDSEGAQWTISFLMEKIISNLRTWSSEVNLVEDTLNLLVTLVERKNRCDIVVKCNTLWKLATDISNNEAPLCMIHPGAKRRLYKALVLAGSASFQGNTKENYWQLSLQSRRLPNGEVKFSLRSEGSNACRSPSKLSGPLADLFKQVLQSLHDRFRQVGQGHELQKVYMREEVKLAVMNILEAMCGVAEAARVDNVDLLFSFFSSLLNDVTQVLDIYHAYEEIVHLVLEMFNTVANRLICYIGEEETKNLLSACMGMIQVYSKHNMGRRAITAMGEEERSTDLLILMEMLTNLLTKDFIDFDSSSSKSSEVTAADVVLVGLQIVIPLMNAEVLKFPDLCAAYFRLVAYLAEVHPDKIIAMPPSQLNVLLESVEMGLKGYTLDISKLCMEFLNSFACQVFQGGYKSSSHIHQATAHFLKVVMQQILIESEEIDIYETASVTLFALICCQQEHYKELVTELLRHQTDLLHYERLVKAFNELTNGLSLSLDRPNKIKFMQNFDAFIVNARGILCIK